MRRREFIAGLGSAATWPLVSHAQQGDRVRRIGVLVGGSENDPVDRIAAVVPELARLGWVEGRNVRIDPRWTNNDADLARTYAKELAALQPDVILAVGSPVTAALHRGPELRSLFQSQGMVKFRQKRSDRLTHKLSIARRNEFGGCPVR